MPPFRRHQLLYHRHQKTTDRHRPHRLPYQIHQNAQHPTRWKRYNHYQHRRKSSSHQIRRLSDPPQITQNRVITTHISIIFSQKIVITNRIILIIQPYEIVRTAQSFINKIKVEADVSVVVVFVDWFASCKFCELIAELLLELEVCDSAWVVSFASDAFSSSEESDFSSGDNISIVAQTPSDVDNRIKNSIVSFYQVIEKFWVISTQRNWLTVY